MSDSLPNSTPIVAIGTVMKLLLVTFIMYVLYQRLCVVERERDSAQRELAEERETAASTSGKWPPAGANNNKQQASDPMQLTHT